jgi:hypothetical protein
MEINCLNLKKKKIYNDLIKKLYILFIFIIYINQGLGYGNYSFIETSLDR